jgi:LysR family glycine cleavage system transcriptional activator
MSTARRRPLAVGPIRAFESVARHLSFRAAAEELFLTQSAISRQIQALEEDLGAPVFLRGTRKVELTQAGVTLLRATEPLLDRLDTSVRQIRQSRGRRVVSVSTFASFASLWLIPRLEAFQREHPQIDIRISASDNLVDPDGNDAGEVDVALRYGLPEQANPHSVQLFDEVVTPMVSPLLLERAQTIGPPLRAPADLTAHTLMEEDNPKGSAEFVSWMRWLRTHAAPDLQPARWVFFNYTHQQVQAALAGQGVAMARLALTVDAASRGELIEVFPGCRLESPYGYWLIKPPAAQMTEDAKRFCTWVEAQAAVTRAAMAAL